MEFVIIIFNCFRLDIWFHISYHADRMNIKLKIISCEVLAEEIANAAGSLKMDISEEYLPAGLHDNPDRLREELQQAVDRVSPDVTEGRAHYNAIITGYGLCGRGTIGIGAGEQT